MKIKTLLYIPFLLSSTLLVAQEIRYGQLINKNPLMEFKKEELATSNLNITYILESISNPAKKNNKTSATTLLQLSKNLSKFTDYYQIQIDSLINGQTVNSSAQEFADNYILLRRKKKYHNSILKNHPTNKITIQHFIPPLGHHQYEESKINFNWKLHKDTRELLGYHCKKASCSFRGRNYTAWYTEEIPISDGPHLFAGLPGLILQIQDTKEHYVFTAQSIDKSKHLIYIDTSQSIQKTTRENTRKIEKNIIDNPASVFEGKIHSSPGKPMNTSSLKSQPYNPIELE